MKMSSLQPGEQEALLRELAAMPMFLTVNLLGLTPAETREPGPENSFAPVEQVWHLADLEREGFAVRIRRLLDEEEPVLADFDGPKVALARNYKQLALVAGLDAFRKARRANLEAIRRIATSQWSRSGVQEGVGRVALCDIPAMMAAHDAEHRLEIEAWFKARRL
jgi:hypothetical protein